MLDGSSHWKLGDWPKSPEPERLEQLSAYQGDEIKKNVFGIESEYDRTIHDTTAMITPRKEQ